MALLKASLGDGRERTLLADPVANALITLPNNHSYIHKGQHFKAGISDRLAEVGDKITLAVSTPGWVPVGNAHYDTVYHMVWRVWGNSEMSFGIYEDAAVSGGTTRTPMNNDRTGAHTYSTDLVVRTGITRTGGDLVLPLYYSGVVGGPGGKEVQGFSNRDDDEILLKPASSTVFELVNLASPFSGGLVNCGIEVAWYEYVPEM